VLSSVELVFPEKLACELDDTPCGPGINIVPFKLLYVEQFNAQLLQSFFFTHLLVLLEHELFDVQPVELEVGQQSVELEVGQQLEELEVGQQLEELEVGQQLLVLIVV